MPHASEPGGTSQQGALRGHFAIGFQLAGAVDLPLAHTREVPIIGIRY